MNPAIKVRGAVTRRCTRGYTAATSSVHLAHPTSFHPSDHAKARIAEIEANRGVSAAFVDTYRREHNYLRISLTEKCNLRCFYCMPVEGVKLSPKPHILTDDEVIRLARLFVQNGVTKIRLTGGEPTIRKGLLDIVRRLNDLRQYGLRSICMTSNGLVLHRNLAQFVENGLTHLNLSLDTLDPSKFEIMTRRMGHDAVLKTLNSALASSLQSVKLNVVVINGLNDSEVPAFIEMTKEKNLSVRFIEFMPFSGNRWDKGKMLPSSDLLSRLQQIHPSITKMVGEKNDTTRSFRIPGYKGSFGFISSMSDHFCSTCNRMRLTADGKIKVCLFDAKEISLRDQMRQGATDEELLGTVALAISGKKEKHAGMEGIDTVTNRPMVLIGVRHINCNTTTDPRFPLIPVDLRFTRQSANVSIRRTFWTKCPRNMATLRSKIFSNSTKDRKSISRLSHFDDQAGRAQMVDIGSKTITPRTAQASGRIYIPEVAYRLITSENPFPDPDETDHRAKTKEKARGKGDVLAVAQLAGIMACKRTSELIPLCHPLTLSHIEVVLTPESREVSEGSSEEHRYSVLCRATASCEGRTGVEMETLTAVSVALLTVWDMLKAVAGKEMMIGEIIVENKTGGKNGNFQRTLQDASVPSDS